MASGYTPCACRDCFDITVSSDIENPELCNECIDANCTPHQNLPGNECQRWDAYSFAESE